MLSTSSGDLRMSVLHVRSGQREYAIMNIPCILLFGSLVSGGFAAALLKYPNTFLVKSACNVMLHAQREPLNFTSPNYPGNYRNNDTCYWDIYPETRGYRVVLEMVYSNIEFSTTCSYDVLTIYVINNANQSEAASKRVCGVKRLNIIIQEDQHVRAVFTTDGSRTTSGFLIRYYETNGTINCGGSLVATSLSKTFISPGYPNTYFPSQICTWTITTEHQNQTIQLDTKDSILQSSSSSVTCDRDSVTIHNGRDGSYQLGRFCLNQRPIFISGGNALSVRLRTDSSGDYKGFKMVYKAVSATTCNVTLPAGQSPMVIVSPGYPNNYVNGLDCQWTIHALIGNTIRVKVLFLDLENVSSCVDDYLLFKDGATNDAHQLSKICEHTFNPIVSSSNHMTIIFHSNGAVTGGGFRLQYSSVTDCGLSDLTASPVSWKYLSSPGYPLRYDNNVYCKWKIRAPYGYEIKVEIVNLSLAYSLRCLKDYLVFKDGFSHWSPKLGKFCGVYNNKQIVSSSTNMTITFTSDGSATRPGFNLKYKAGTFPKTTTTTTTITTTERPHVSNCGSSFLSASKYSWRYLSSPGYPYRNYNNNMHCEWTIHAPAGYIVKVQVQNISMEYDPSCSKDYLIFRDGSSSYATQLGKYCNDYTGYFSSSRNAITITFRTDSSFTDRGFSLKYKAAKTGCGEDHTIRYETTYIESPKYSLSYPDNADCEWTISTSIDGYVIHVEVVYFNIEFRSSLCPYDYVQLYDVTIFERSMGRWCGTDGPNTQTTGQTMKVVFHSDGSTSLAGFKLSFTANEPTSGSGSSKNIGAILGGVFGFITAVGIATCCCYGLRFRKKSRLNEQQQRDRSHEGTVSFINAPIHPPTSHISPTAPTAVPFMFPPPPSYDDVVKDDPPPYCEAVALSDSQPVVTVPSDGSEYQGTDNPAGTCFT